MTRVGKPPPPEWRPDEPRRLEIWKKEMNYVQRMVARKSVLRDQRRQQRIAAGTASLRDIAHAEGRGTVQRRVSNAGRLQRMTSEEADRHRQEANRVLHDRRSASHLAFILSDQNVTPPHLADKDCPHAQWMPHVLTEFDHEVSKRDVDAPPEQQKVAPVTRLIGDERRAEREKSSCKCLVCHRLRTAIQLRRHVQSVPSGAQATISDLKLDALRCAHPCHAHMQYAAIVDDALNDTNVAERARAGILEMSHLECDGQSNRRSVEQLLKDVRAGLTEILCVCCHRLQTMLEQRSKQLARWSGMETKGILPVSAMTAFHFQQLQESPGGVEFISNFEQKTARIDWLAKWKEESDTMKTVLAGVWSARKRSAEEFDDNSAPAE